MDKFVASLEQTPSLSPGPASDQTELLFAVLSAIDTAFIIWSDDDKLLLCNDGMRDLWGYPDELLVKGTPLIELVRFQAGKGVYGAGDVETQTQERLAKLKLFQGHERDFISMPNGKILRARVFNVEGLGRVFSYTDVSGAMQAEQTIRDNEARFREILSTSPIGIAVISNQTKERIFVNQAMVDLFGAKSEADLLNQDIAITWRDPSQLAHVREMMATDRRLVNYLAERVRLDGSTCWALLNSHNAIFAGEECRVVWHHDITARREMEIALQESQDQLEILNANKDRFFSIIAHDLRGPFTGLLGYSNFLAQIARNEGSEKIAEAAECVHDSAQNVYNLLEDLLNWSKLQMDHVAFNPQKTDATKIVRETFSLFRSIAGEKGLHLNTDTISPVDVYADPDMASTIVRNLVNNAIKFTPEGGTVSVSIDKRETVAELKIADNGIGLSKGQLDRLFVISEKSQRPGTGGEVGTGLGMYLCKELTEKNGGEIRVESEVGKGSIFTVTFPLNEA